MNNSIYDERSYIDFSYINKFTITNVKFENNKLNSEQISWDDNSKYYSFIIFINKENYSFMNFTITIENLYFNNNKGPIFVVNHILPIGIKKIKNYY